MYINDIPLYVSTSSTLLYKDDTECFKLVRSSSGAASLQADLASLSGWKISAAPLIIKSAILWDSAPIHICTTLVT